MVQRLAQAGWAPAVVHHSHARRTCETAAQFSATGIPLHEQATFYLRGLSAIFEAARSWPPEQAGPVLVLGHNPGWAEAATELSGQAVWLAPGDAALLTTQAPNWSVAFQQRWQLNTVLHASHDHTIYHL